MHFSLIFMFKTCPQSSANKDIFIIASNNSSFESSASSSIVLGTTSTFGILNNESYKDPHFLFYPASSIWSTYISVTMWGPDLL